MNNSFTNKISRPARKSSGFLSITIVPDHGETRRFKIATFWLKIGGGIAGLFLLLLVAAIVSYTSLLTKAMQRDMLVADNLKLKEENKKVAVLAKQVEESRLYLNRIIRSLGGKLDLPDSLLIEAP
jgi:hypothetical protein